MGSRFDYRWRHLQLNLNTKSSRLWSQNTYIAAFEVIKLRRTQLNEGHLVDSGLIWVVAPFNVHLWRKSPGNSD